MTNKTIWLTGSSGLVGRSISGKLVAQGVSLLSVTNQAEPNYPGSQQNTSAILRNRVRFDFSQASQIDAACERFGVPNILIHAGWGGMTEPDSEVHVRENVEDASVLMTTLYGVGLEKVVFLGSIDEYGQRDGKLSEVLEPRGTLRSYALGKREVASRGFREAKKRDSIYVHVRLANTYGAPQRGGSLIDTLHQAYETGEAPQLGACAIYRDYIHTSEVAEGILRICEIDVSTTVNLGSGTSVLLRDFVMQYWDILGGDREKLIFGAASGVRDRTRLPRPFMDLTRLEEFTKWRPGVSTREGIQLTVAAISQDT